MVRILKEKLCLLGYGLIVMLDGCLLLLYSVVTKDYVLIVRLSKIAFHPIGLLSMYNEQYYDIDGAGHITQ